MRTPAIAFSVALSFATSASARADSRAPSAPRTSVPVPPAPAPPAPAPPTPAPPTPVQSAPAQSAPTQSAPAQSAPTQTTSDSAATAIPRACQAFIKAAQSPTPQVSVPARISLASCLAQQAVAPVALCDCGQSIVDLDKAIAPALAVLDDLLAASASDFASQVLAEHAKGELYASLIIRMQATLPRASPTATPAELNLRTVRGQTLEAQLAPWRDAAQDSYARVIDLARQHPDLARIPAVAAALRDSQSRLARDAVATSD